MHRKVPAWFGPEAVGKGAAQSGNLANGLPVFISAVRDLNRLELAGESVRAAAEAVVAAAPAWFAAVFEVSGWSARHGRRIDSWRLPTSQAKRDRLAADYGADGFALIGAVYDRRSPAWLRELSAVQVLRVVLLQNYLVEHKRDGSEVIRLRDADKDGVPPAPSRIASPYDTDARWAAKGEDLFWCGYKVHVSETCDDPAPAAPGRRSLDAPNIITNVATTDATVPDASMTAPVQADLAARGLAPGEHYVDSGYASAALILSSRTDGIDLVTPLLADTSAQAKAGAGYARADFVFDFDTATATCPAGKTSASWSPCAQRATAAIVVTFAKADCGPCPARPLCTTSKAGRRQLSIPAREVHEVQVAARAEQATKDWQERYARRAGVEGTIDQAVDLGIRRARFRGIDKVRLQHILTACAINLIRLDAYWNGHVLDRTRTSHISRLALDIAA